MKSLLCKAIVFVSTVIIISIINNVEAAEWKNHPELPDIFKRGNLRMIFSVVRPEENFFTAGCNFYRGAPGEGYDERNVYSMIYISPTDYFWHDRLWREHYAKNTTLPLAGSGLEYTLNMDKNYPELHNALVKNPDGSEKIIRKGSYTERKVGCRNQPLWQSYRQADVAYQYEGSTAPEAANHEFFKTLPSKQRRPEVRSLFIDNAGVIPCHCELCKKQATKLAEEFTGTTSESIAAQREMNARTPAKFNALLHQISHKYNRVMMPNYTTGCAFANLRQAQIYPPDAICWELTFLHPPWGRCLPYYKRGLAASGGVANAAVTLDMPLPGTMGDAMPVLTQDFTRMALAEGMATQGSYILKGEIDRGFFSAAREYNRFNALFPEIYTEAGQNGRIAIVCSVRDGLYAALNDGIYDKLTNRLTAMGIPIEVITEDELNDRLSERFDILIIPSLENAAPSMLDALVKFSQKNGAMLIPKELGDKNLYNVKTDSPQSKQLKAAANSGKGKIRFLEKFGNSLSDSALLDLLLSINQKSLPQKFKVIDKNADFIINALKKDNINTYHIVNYQYSVVPFELLNEKGVTFSVTTPKANPKFLYIYGSSRSGSAKTDLFYNGKLLTKVAFTGNNWQRIDVSKLALPIGNHQFTLKKIADEVAIYPKSGGVILANVLPAQIPLRAVISPLINSTLQITNPANAAFAAVITPDGESKMLPVKKERNGISVNLDYVKIYSVVLFSDDEEKLQNLVKRANAERQILNNGMPMKDAQKLLAKLPGNTDFWRRSITPVFKCPGVNTLQTTEFSAPDNAAYKLSSLELNKLPGLMICNQQQAAPPFVILNSEKQNAAIQEIRNAAPGRKSLEYRGDLYLFVQPLTDAELSVKLNKQQIGIIKLTAANQPEWVRFNLKDFKIKSELSKFEITAKQGIVILAVNRSSADTANLPAGAYAMTVSANPPAPFKPAEAIIPLQKTAWKIPGTTFNSAVFLAPEQSAILLEAVNTPDSKTFILPEIRTYATVIPAASEGDLVKIIEEHDALLQNKNQTITRTEAKKYLTSKRGNNIKVKNYSASSSHSAPKHNIDVFNKNAKGHWIDGTPNRYPDFVDAELLEPSLINKVVLTFPAAEGVAQQYEVQIFDEEVGNWRTVAKIENNQSIRHEINFPETITQKVRILFLLGGMAQQNRYSALQSFTVNHVNESN